MVALDRCYEVDIARKVSEFLIESFRKNVSEALRLHKFPLFFFFIPNERILYLFFAPTRTKDFLLHSSGCYPSVQEECTLCTVCRDTSFLSCSYLFEWCSFERLCRRFQRSLFEFLLWLLLFYWFLPIVYDCKLVESFFPIGVFRHIRDSFREWKICLVVLFRF